VDVIVAGGHGKIGIRLLERLAARGDRARGLIRDPAQAADLEAVGAEAVVIDLEGEEDPTPHLLDATALVFAAGAGAGSGPERKRTLDYGACVKLLRSAEALGIGRFVVVSSMGADAPEAAPEAMRPYQQAKADADAAVQASGLAWTIVRPGALTDAPARGRVAIAERLGYGGSISRDDVADVLVAVLDTPTSAGTVFGRRSPVQFSRTSPSCSGSMSKVRIARPCSSSTLEMSPIRTPETRTVWPWPGVTACPVENAPFRTNGLSSMSGKRRRCSLRM